MTGTMNIALFASSPAPIARLFIERHQQTLLEEGVFVRLLVVDENARKRQNPIKHAMRVASRQARIAGCSTAHALIKILTYKALVEVGA